MITFVRMTVTERPVSISLAYKRGVLRPINSTTDLSESVILYKQKSYRWTLLSINPYQNTFLVTTWTV